MCLIKEFKYEEKLIKKTKKDDKKKKKFKKRAINESKIYKYFIRWLIYITIIGLIVGIFVLSKHQIERYNATSKWKKLQRVEMAKMEPFMLSLNDDDYQVANILIEVKDKIWDEKKQNFLQDISDSNIQLFKTNYSKLPIKNNSLNEFNSRVIDNYWPIYTQKKLVASDNVINKEMTFNDIANYLNESSSKLNSFYQDSIDGSFLFDLNEFNQLISKDLVTISNFTNQFINLITIEGNDFYINDNVKQKDVNSCYDVLNNLNFEWTQLNELKSKKETIIAFVKSNEAKITDYANYENNESIKNAFNTYLTNYKSSINEIESSKVELKNLVGLTVDEAIEWCQQNQINYTFRYTETNNKDQKNVITSQSVDNEKYKFILKNSTIELNAIKYVAPATTYSSNSSTRPSNTYGSSGYNQNNSGQFSSSSSTQPSYSFSQGDSGSNNNSNSNQPDYTFESRN